MKDKCKIERVARSVIEHRLLAALDDEKKVAILATKQDLEDFIAALSGYKLGERQGNILTWEAHDKRVRQLADDMRQLLSEAFPNQTPATEKGLG